jgi:hypothetical protein
LWADFRAIPVEVLRDFVRSRAEITSIRQVAAETGLGRTTLHSFVNGETTPHPRVRRVIALWYLDWLETAPDLDVVRPYASALEVLISGMPETQRDGTLAVVLDGLESGYTGGGEPPPRWVELLRFVTRRGIVAPR